MCLRSSHLEKLTVFGDISINYLINFIQEALIALHIQQRIQFAFPFVHVISILQNMESTTHMLRATMLSAPNLHFYQII